MATVDDITQAFAADIASGTLPQVSWIIVPAALSEHANYHPQAGGDLSARLLAALTANLAVWSRTVFLLNDDEQGGFFDHAPPRTPPADDAEGSSMVVGVPGGGNVSNTMPLSASGNWFDFSVTVDTHPAFLRRFAGRLENGHDLVSDPAAA